MFMFSKSSYDYRSIKFLSISSEFIDKLLSRLASRKKIKTFKKKYKNCLFITSKSTLRKSFIKKDSFLSGPTLVLKSINNALSLVSNQIFIEDWSSKIFSYKFFKNSFKKDYLICGIPCFKLLIAKILRPKSDLILLLMNANPAYRLKQIRRNLGQYPVDVIREEIPFPPYLQSILLFLADRIILVGNDHTLNSYLKSGWQKSFFNIANAQIDSNFFNTKSLLKEKKDKLFYCFPASMHGHRKGLFYSIYSWIKFFKKIKELNKKSPTLIMTGNLPIEYENYLRIKFGENYQQEFNIDFKGWVSAQDLLDIYKKCAFIISTPLEEGQVAAVLEAVACGVTPIISKDTGITFNNYQYVDNYKDNGKYSLIDALLLSYEKEDFFSEDNFLKEKNRVTFLEYYSKASVYKSTMSLFV